MAAAPDVIRDYYARFNAGDRERFFALMTDDIVHDINQGGRETGKDAFRVFMRRMDRCYREQISDIVVMANDTGERAAAEFIVSGTYLASDEGLPPASGQTYRLPCGAFFTLRGGQVARVTNFYNLQDWLRQVGG
jgi:steroid delta-isomerase-like uncharacterized protein